jgi:hypothetical protein
MNANRKLAVVLLLTAVIVALVLLHVPGVNGPWYWQWTWRRLSWWVWPAMLAAAAPFAAAQWANVRGRIKSALLLLALATLCLELTALAFQPPAGLRRLAAIVRDTTNTSYWMDATILHGGGSNVSVAQFLTAYADLLPQMHLHTQFKPPGLVLYYHALIELLGDRDAAAWAGGIGIALLAAAAPPACWLMLRKLGRDGDGDDGEADEAAFCGASFFALCPSLVLFLPQFDQAYPLLACLILVAWTSATRDASWQAAVACGLVIAVALFCSYIFLTLGCFFAASLVLIFADRDRAAAGRAILCACLAAATCVFAYVLLFLATGFHAIETFQAISAMQVRGLLALWPPRPFPLHVAWDVYDFALGSGWISYGLVVFFLASIGRRLFDHSPQHRFVLLALIQILAVAGAALLPGETARLWLPLMPLLMAPVGLELARWPAKQRWIVYACLWVILVAVAQNMTFIYMGEAIDGPRR